MRIVVVLAIVLVSGLGPASGAAVRLPSIELPGAVMQVDINGPVDDAKATELLEWIRDAAVQVSSTYGRFPVPEPRVVLIATRSSFWSNSPVPFGRVTRNKGEIVELYVDISRPVDDLYGDWTALHEFSHLMLPRISSRQRWVAEGFASYYQNVLMSRAGHYTVDEGIRLLSAGLERGRASRPALSPNEAAREGMRRARMKIYWSGAAIALLADIELRKRSDGRESLDTVLGRFQACCLPSNRRWSGYDFFTRLDTLLDEPVFIPLYHRHANSPGFPDVTTALRDELLREEIFAVRSSPN